MEDLPNQSQALEDVFQIQIWLNKDPIDQKHKSSVPKRINSTLIEEKALPTE